MAKVTMEQMKRDLMVNIAINQPSLCVGPVGVGKTTVIRDACKEYALQIGRPFTYLEKRASEMDPTDLAIPMPDMATGRMRTFIADWLPQVDRDGPEGLLCFDEFTDAPIGTQAVLNQIVLERKWLPAGWRVAATGNRQIDRAAAQAVSRASANRFAILEAVVEFASAINWFMATSQAVELIAWLGQCEREGKIEALHKYPEGSGRDAVAFTTPRSIASCSPLFAAGLPDSELRRQIDHRCGEETAQSIMSFLASWRLLPDLDAIERDPLNAPLHREPSTNYALMVALSNRATMAKLPNIVLYVNRFDPLYRATFWNLAVTRDKAYEATAEYVAHLVRQGNTGI